MLIEFIQQFLANEYLSALIYLISLFFILRFLISMFERIILKLTLKTKSNLDDLILQKLKTPFTIIAFLIGFNLAFSTISNLTQYVQFIQRIVQSFIILILVYAISISIDLAFSRIWKKISSKTKLNSNEALMQLFKGISKASLFTFGGLWILNIWGVAIGPLLTGLGIGGVAIAFALQPSLANIFGGISIILDKSVRVGDLVNLEGNVSGKILNIGLRSTKVKTFDNEIVIVPNSKLSNENIHNVAKPDPIVRVVVPFGVAYGSNIEKVKKIVMAEIKKIKGLKKTPDPSIKFLEMGDSSLNFKAYFFVETFEIRLSAMDEANTRIYNALNKAKIEIPFPQMDINLKK